MFYFVCFLAWYIAGGVPERRASNFQEVTFIHAVFSLQGGAQDITAEVFKQPGKLQPKTFKMCLPEASITIFEDRGGLGGVNKCIFYELSET